MIKRITQPKVYPVIKNLPALYTEAPIQSMMRLANQYDGIYKMQFGDQTVIILSDPDLVNEVCDESRFDKKVHQPLHKLRDLGGDGLFTAFTH